MAVIFDSLRHFRRKLFTCIVFSVFVFLALLHWQSVQRFPSSTTTTTTTTVPPPIATDIDSRCDPDPPANWDKLYKWEDDLPQHDVNLPFPEGKTGRYVYFKNQIQQLGWNNQLNEVLMNTYLAYKSNRAYVFQDYIWRYDHYPWMNLSKKPEIPRTPLNALISGPSAGGPWDPTDTAPRAISHRFIDVVCPPNERRIINTRDVKPAIYWEPNGRVIFEHWQKLLSEAPERCIEIQPANHEEDGVPQTFDLWFWGSGKSNDLWEEFRDSAVSRLLKTSPIVEAAVAKNEYIVRPRGPRPPSGASNDPYERMLAVHIRRGDYKQACMGLARWNSTFYSWNLLSFLPDKFIHPPGWEVDQELTTKTYMAHCYPTGEFILDKIREAHKAYIQAAKPGEVRYLDTVYILTNDKTEWIERLMRMLSDDGWHHVVTTRQLELDSQQKGVGMSVDMDMARRAAVFIGNGWSSFSSNIVHRRLVDGKEPISIRFL